MKRPCHALSRAVTHREEKRREEHKDLCVISPVDNSVKAAIAALKSDPRFYVTECGGCIWVELQEKGRYTHGCYVSHVGLEAAHRNGVLTAYVLDTMTGMQ